MQSLSPPSPEARCRDQQVTLEWLTRDKDLSRWLQQAPPQPIHSRGIPLHEWLQYDLAYTNQYSLIDGTKPRPGGARGVHDCITLAFVNPHWQAQGASGPLALFHAHAHLTVEQLVTAIKRLEAHTGKPQFIPLVGGETTSFTLLTKWHQAMQRTGYLPSSINIGACGAEHFLVDPMDATVTEIYVP